MLPRMVLRRRSQEAGRRRGTIRIHRRRILARIPNYQECAEYLTFSTDTSVDQSGARGRSSSVDCGYLADSNSATANIADEKRLH